MSDCPSNGGVKVRLRVKVGPKFTCSGRGVGEGAFSYFSHEIRGRGAWSIFFRPRHEALGTESSEICLERLLILQDVKTESLELPHNPPYSSEFNPLYQVHMAFT